MSNEIFTRLEVNRGYFALGKADQESRVFSALVKGGEIDLATPRFELAIQLGISQAKVENLIFKYRLNNYEAKEALAAAVSQLIFVEANHRTQNIVFSIEDKFYRELLVATLKKSKISADSSFNREFITVSASHFGLLVNCLTNVNADEITRKLNRAKRLHNVESIFEVLVKIALPNVSSMGPILASLGL